MPAANPHPNKPDTPDDDPRWDFRLIRTCFTCYYYRASNSNTFGKKGICFWPKRRGEYEKSVSHINRQAKMYTHLPAYACCVCDKWKLNTRPYKEIKKWCGVVYGMELEEEDDE